MDRESFVFYRSFAKACKRLSPELRIKVYDALIDYALDDVNPEDEDGIVLAILDLIKPQVDANNKRRENGKKGAEFGEMGGRPKVGTPNKKAENPKETPKEPQENPTQTPNVNVNVNDNVNVNVEKENTKEKDAVAKLVIDYLNQKTGKAFRYSESSLRHIRARLNEGFTLGDCMRVIDNKVSEWGRRNEMEKYLRPETLFGGKFEGYLNQVEDVSLPEFMRENRPKMPREITPLTTTGEIEALMNQLGD